MGNEYKTTSEESVELILPNGEVCRIRGDKETASQVVKEALGFK